MKKNKTKRENPLRIWSPRYRFPIFLWHPLYAIKTRWRDLKNFLHRGQYGYAYSDVWNWNTWWSTVGAEALRYLANHGCGYPGMEPWDTEDKWKAYLLDMADKLQWCGDSIDRYPYDNEERNQYAKQMEEIRVLKYRKDLPLTPEEETVKNLYWERVDEIWNEDVKKREEIFAEIGRNFGRFWD